MNDHGLDTNGDGFAGLEPFGTRFSAEAPVYGRGVRVFALRGRSVFTGSALDLSQVYGSGIKNENGVLTLSPGKYFALYSFGARTANSVPSVRVAPVHDGVELEYGSVYAARLPSGMLAHASGFFAVSGGTLAFRCKTESPARLDGAEFTLALLPD